MSIKKRNIFLVNTDISIPFRSRTTRGTDNFPKRDNHKSHADFIEKKLLQCYETSNAQKQAAAIRFKEGVYLEFSSAIEHEF